SGKGARHLLCEAPEGPFRQKVPGTFSAGLEPLQAKLVSLADDPDLAVRYQTAFTLGQVKDDKAIEALVRLAKRDTDNQWMRLAVLSSSAGRAGELLARLTTDHVWRAAKPARRFLEEMANQVGLQNNEKQIAQVIGVLDGLDADDEADKTAARSIVRGLTRGLAASGSDWLAKLRSDEHKLIADLVKTMVEEALEKAADEDLKISRRVEAVESLALASLDESVDVLAELLESHQPKGIQTAALAALGRHRGEEVAEVIVEAWAGFSPQVQNSASETLFARSERILVLLEALEAHDVLPSQLDPARIAFLLAHPDKQIQAKAKELLGGVKLARREEVVKAYRDVLKMKGDVTRGKAVFKKQCSTCHALEGVGYELGLPLTGIQNRGPAAMLEATLDPNREVQPQYLNYVVITDKGLSVTGMIDSESATSLTLKRAEGESDTILRVNIDQLNNTGLSLMPEGLEKQLSKQDMADVIAYVMSLK
ncbi:MAG: c-type cytochrome, partial [Pirellulales bacterium]|nr:c-type cytochrome [Pirellulales bacterium]